MTEKEEGQVEELPAEGELAAPEAEGEPAVVEGENGLQSEETPPAVEGEDPVAPPKPDHRDRRIAKLTAKLKAAQEQLAAAKPGAAIEPPTPPSAVPPDAVRAEALRLREQEKFLETCNEAAVLGRSTFGEKEFNSAVAVLSEDVNPANPAEQARYEQFLQSAIETGAAHKVIMLLAQDLTEADRIMDLPPAKQAIALERLAAKAPAEKVSSAAKPITPIGRLGAQHTQIDPGDAARADQLSTAEWMKRRNAQEAARLATLPGRRRVG